LRLRDGNRSVRTIALDYSHTVHNSSTVEFAARPPRQSLLAPPRPADNDRLGDWHCVKVSQLLVSFVLRSLSCLSCLCYS